MRLIFLVVVFSLLMLVGVAVKDWQCMEMFPNADRLACLMWK